MATDGFDAFFHQLDGEVQQDEVKKNEITSNTEMAAESDAYPATLDDGFGLARGQTDAFTYHQTQSPKAEKSMQLPEEAFKTCIKNYFGTTQKLLPLVAEQRFMQATLVSGSCQAQALKYAICMAGAHVDGDVDLEEQCYKYARYHLEQAELDVQGSTFWTLEAAQALVLVGRYEFTHMKSPRALITVARLDGLLSVLNHCDMKNLNSTRAPAHGSMSESSTQLELKHACFLALSLKSINLSFFLPHDKSGNSPISLLGSRWADAVENNPGQHVMLDNISASKIRKLDSFSVFMLSLRIAADSEQHLRDTATDAAGPIVKYNFCQAHDRIDHDIGVLASSVTSSTQWSTGNLENELSVLALITVLGARIKLFNTAILHSNMASFLRPVVSECLKQNFLTAKDISDLLLRAQVLEPARFGIYREASFYIMPSLVLAAEAHLRLTSANVSKSDAIGSKSPHHHLARETRESLSLLCKVMEACKDETDRYDNLLVECKDLLGASETGKWLRTEFVNLDRHSATSLE
ncbi:hypothetical protein QQS21_006467 [Conoideocrella luteorostrata]|uniref:Transcription factor domain-containing protein n=1 Tax=Conoideocrella luteorostrata TaxID=1105319 RepID=A0AAJ0CQI2_9HYPO|nr:hypothetical protein QQS21_006467 [Conoideocrella luteorostrata]